MFPKLSNPHVFKPKSVHKAIGAGALGKLGKTAIKTVQKIIKKKITKGGGKKSAKKQSGKKKKQKSSSKKKPKKSIKKGKKKPTRDIFL